MDGSALDVTGQSQSSQLGWLTQSQQEPLSQTQGRRLTPRLCSDLHTTHAVAHGLLHHTYEYTCTQRLLGEGNFKSEWHLLNDEHMSSQKPALIGNQEPLLTCKNHFSPANLHKVVKRVWGSRSQTLPALEACS